MAKWRQLCALLRKNFIIKRRRPISSLFELLFPIFAFFVLASLKDSFQPAPQNKVSVLQPKNSLHNIPFNLPLHGGSIAYAPNNNATQLVMSTMVKNYIRYMTEFYPTNNLTFESITLNGLQTKSEMEQYLTLHDFGANEPFSRPDTSPVLLGGVFFPNLDGSPLPKSVDYLLYYPSSVYPDYGRKTKIWFIDFFQQFLEIAVIEAKTLTTSSPLMALLDQLKLIQYYLANGENITSNLSSNDSLASVLTSGLVVTTMMAFLSIIGSPVKDIIAEKETRIKEAMKMMGLRTWVHWFTWFLTIFSSLLIITTCCTFILYSYDFFFQVEISIFLCLFIAYSLSVVSFIFLISSLFNRSRRASVFLSFIYMGSFLPWTWFTKSVTKLSPIASNTICLLNSSCFAIGLQIMSDFEQARLPLDWHSIGSNPKPDSEQGFTVLYCIFFLLLDSVLYFLCAYYIDEVFPGEFGIPREPFFFLKKSYWSKNTSLEESIPTAAFDCDTGSVSPKIEHEPTNIPSGIRIHHLTKAFPGGKVAVNDLSLNMYEGQITSLLGHNGAGKTTLMSILCGLFPPSKGTAFVSGYDIRTDLDSVRDSLGLCPQFDILFDSLTVMEHLWFFSELKGVCRESVEADVNELILDLSLYEKRNSIAKVLSGGQKRRLSVAIAFVGGSKVIILDEPTSGMDPYSRRATWNLLLKSKPGRTIVLSTHFMDEADLLGDRIAIIANGSLRCLGSSLFLKKIYGVGYHLTLAKAESFRPHEAASGDSNNDQIVEFIKKFIPDMILNSSFGTELSFTIPSHHSKHFEAFFLKLDQNLKKLGLQGYGISATTMEEVFLAVGNEVDHEKTQLTRSLSRSSSENIEVETARLIRDDYKSSSVSHHYEQSQGLSLVFQQVCAMLKKRALNAFRQIKVWIYQLVGPLFLAYLAFNGLNSPHQPPASGISNPSFSANPVSDTLLLPYFCKDSPFPVYISPNVTEDVSRVGNLVFEKLSDFHRHQTFPNIFKPYLTSNITKVFENSNFVVAGGLGFFQVPSGNSFDYGTFPASHDLSYQSSERFQLGVSVIYKHSAASLRWIETSILGILHNALSVLILGEGHSIRLLLEEAPSASNSSGFGGITADMDAFTALNGDPFADLVSYYVMAFYLALSFAMVVNGACLFVVREKATNAKEIQLISSHPCTFWVSHFLWDFFVFLIPLAAISALAHFLHVQPFEGSNLFLFILVCLSYGFASTFQVYLLSLSFENAASAQSFISLFNTLTVIVPGCIALLVKLAQVETGIWYYLVDYGFCILPNYVFLSFMFSFVKLSLDSGSSPGDHALWNMCWHSCAHLMILGIVFFVLLLFFECGMIRKLVKAFRKNAWRDWVKRKAQDNICTIQAGSEIMVPTQEDADVTQERCKVSEWNQSPHSSYDLVVKDLSKVFSGSLFSSCFPKSWTSEEKLAVNQLSLGIAPGECFGLLGHNGAGKTTTFKMLTGSLAPTYGDAWILGKSTVDDFLTARLVIGYCPQENAFIDHLTGREMLTMYAHIRGIPRNFVARDVESLIFGLGLSDYADARCENYSGGNKRKLMVACALISNPAILFLDEPSTGMDPVSRRILWTLLQSSIQERGHCIVLTSHSMEECEALCTRLAIMIDGSFRCLGSPQHLKNRFGNGYVLIIRLKHETASQNPLTSPDHLIESAYRDVESIKVLVVESIPSAVLIEQQTHLVRYEIPYTETSIGKIFGKMEAILEKSTLIEDYSLSQTTLEQVFIHFIKTQARDVAAD